MKKIEKMSVLAVLIVIIILFSGCSIKKKSDVETSQPEAPVSKTEEPKKIDTDADGLFDDEEEKLGTDKNSKDAEADGLSDYDEVKKWKTNPLVKDTDGDGYDDGLEVQNGYDPNGPGQLDSDNDSLMDPEERKLGTDPNKFDTDGDGLSDGEEVGMSRDPLVMELTE